MSDQRDVKVNAGVAEGRAVANPPGIGVVLPPPEPGVKRGASLKQYGRPGRPPGRRSPRRESLIAEVRADPAMPDAVVNERGHELGIWGPDSANDYDSVRKRVARIRKAAQETG